MREIEQWLDWPEWAEDQIFTHVDVHLGWRDRLRVFLRGHLLLAVKTYVEHRPGNLESKTRVSVPPIFTPKNLMFGQASEGADDAP